MVPARGHYEDVAWLGGLYLAIYATLEDRAETVGIRSVGGQLGFPIKTHSKR